MIAAIFDHSRVVRILLNKGANVSVVDVSGWTALHWTAERGHLAGTKLLVKAGAEREATNSDTGSTPLHLAVEKGHSEIMAVLFEAGVDPNRRRLDGLTPLFMAASQGHVDAVKVLIHAQADPLLTCSEDQSGPAFIPLDAAAESGHLEIARELIQEHGIEGCGGATDGVQALRLAAQYHHVEIMDLLTSAGVVDPGIALLAATGCGHESSVKFLLLQQQEEWRASGESAAYLNMCDTSGRTPLLCSVAGCYPCSPRITRALVDAGADTTTRGVWCASTARPWLSWTVTSAPRSSEERTLQRSN